MATYSTFKVQRDYSSTLGTFEEGTTVELEDDIAEHIERDSPGTLKATAGKKRAEERPPADRMRRAAPNREFPDGPPLSRIPPPQYPLVPTEEDAKEVQAASVAGPDVAAEVIADKDAEDPDVNTKTGAKEPARKSG